MKYHIGDKVRIRVDLSAHITYEVENDDYDDGRMDVDPEMEDWRGKIVTISCINGCSYDIEEDGGDWSWSIGMFDQDFQAEQPVFKEDEWKSLMDF